ncbi:hypothetical protein [Halocola ammonii]
MTHLRPLLLLFFALYFASPQHANAAPNNFGDQFTEANQLMEEGLWRESIQIWLDLVKANPENANLNFKLGYCYLQTATDKDKALKYLEKAAEIEMSKNYDPYEPKEETAPVETLYYLGHSLHLNYQLDRAIDIFEEFKKRVKRKHHLFAEAEHQIAMCKVAKKLVANPREFGINTLGPIVNSRFEEHSPVISIDENALFFTSTRVRDDSSNVFQGPRSTPLVYEDIYVSYRNRAGEWQKPELLNINKQNAHSATVSVSPDGQKLIIYFDDSGNGDLFISELVGETWSEPEPLNPMINSDAWESHASMTADEETIFFVSNREGGQGGRDIYRVTTLPTGDWSKPLNLGQSINTPYEEDAVYIAPDGKTLYFSSNGHKSMGGFDIFYSSLGTDGEWSKPENIGYPLNTADDDLFFSPTADGSRAYYSSRKEGGFGLKDIYSIDLPNLDIEANFTVLKGFIYAPEGESLPPDASLQVTDLETNEVFDYNPRQRDGGYVAILPPCKKYRLEYFANGNVVSSEEMELPCNSNYRELKKEVFLQPVYVNGAEPNTGLELETDEGAAEAMDEKEEDKETDETEESEAETAEVEVVESEEEEEIGIDELSEFEVTFSRRFNYAHNTFEGNDANFRQFVNSVKEITENDRMVIITIEGSASKVPTSDYASNYELAMSRAQNAKKIISQKLKEAGVPESAIRFEELKASVQGPNYNNDVNENRKVYERFQYIKVTAK